MYQQMAMPMNQGQTQFSQAASGSTGGKQAPPQTGHSSLPASYNGSTTDMNRTVVGAGRTNNIFAQHLQPV